MTHTQSLFSLTIFLRNNTGMMDGAYFTSRKDILDFFNSLLDMSLTKIEQTASGAVACQLFDYLFPGSVQMKKVNWHARSDFQFIENYKILQMAMTKANVRKSVDVDRLIRAKYQDNLEFCQWLKAFFEQSAPANREDYNAVQRRLMGKGGSKNLDPVFMPMKTRGNSSRPSMATGAGVRSSSVTRSSSASTARGISSSNRSVSGNASVSSGNSNSASLRSSTAAHGPNVPKTLSVKPRTPMLSTAAPTNNKRTVELEVEKEELLRKNDILKRKNAETELILESIEKERDFYFDKLRGIEVMLQVHEERPGDNNPEALIQKLFKVLYAKLEDNIVVTDDGELLENMVQDGVGDDLLNDTVMSIMNHDDDHVEEETDENITLEENRSFKVNSMDDMFYEKSMVKEVDNFEEPTSENVALEENTSFKVNSMDEAFNMQSMTVEGDDFESY